MIQTTSKIFDLNTFQTVEVVKQAPAQPPVASMAEALSRTNGDETKLVGLINKALEDLQKQELRDSAEPWMVKDDEGALSAFDGSPADEEAVGALVITMARNLFGLTPQIKGDERRAIKQKALDFIRANEPIRAMLSQAK